MVDGGYLQPQGVYTGPQDFKYQVVRQLIVCCVEFFLETLIITLLPQQFLHFCLLNNFNLLTTMSRSTESLLPFLRA